MASHLSRRSSFQADTISSPSRTFRTASMTTRDTGVPVIVETSFSQTFRSSGKAIEMGLVVRTFCSATRLRNGVGLITLGMCRCYIAEIDDCQAPIVLIIYFGPKVATISHSG